MGDAEREREREVREQSEEVLGNLIRARGGSGWTASASGGGGATGSVTTGREVEDDRDTFARSPLAISLVFAGRSFSLLISVFFYFFSVFDLIGYANELQNV